MWRGPSTHLPRGLDASDDTQVHDCPAGSQAGQQPPLHGATVLDGSRDVQRLAVPEVAHGAGGPALLHEPWNQVIVSRAGRGARGGGTGALSVTTVGCWAWRAGPS